jgi:hypothetical protein
MTLNKLREVLNSLTRLDIKSKSEVIIHKKYKYIVDNISNTLDKRIIGTWKNNNRSLRLDLDLSKIEREKLKNKKVKGKNIFQRIISHRNQLIRDFKRIIKQEEAKKKKSLRERLRSEYYKVKRTVVTDSHRIIENTKSTFYDKAIQKNENIEKVWICRFVRSRDAHKEMHEQVADENGYFTAPTGEKTKYPGGFGIAKLDINCHCRVKLRRKNNV